MLDYLSQFYLPGAVTVWCAVLFGLASMMGYVRMLDGDRSALAFARRGYFFFTGSVVLSAVVLAISLARRDFRIEYVYQYSGMDLPIHFQVAAFWAGQKGSFLIWLLCGALLGIPLLKTAGRQEPAVMGFYLLNLFGLLFILVRENPFIMLKETPLDGAGLNPLLQDDWMVIHPPIMFVGYAASAIPMAFALGALWSRDTSSWARRAFPWTLFGFLVLGAAIMLGGYWAYETLGWGGYWGWDPVENASLIPWLIATVLIHGLYMERTKKRYRRINLVLASLMYLSVLYGTFLTRSGVLADFSVHSFVDLGLSRWLVVWMGFFVLASIGLLIRGLGSVETRANEDPFFSRGFFLMLSTITVAASAILVTIGTSATIITRWFMETPAPASPSFYNAVHFPLAVIMALLLTIVPFLTWKGTPTNRLLSKLVPALSVGLLVTLGAVLTSDIDRPFHLLFIFLATAALASNLHKTLEKLRGPGGLRSAGGYLAHVGVGVMMLGILASSAYDQSAKVTLEHNTPLQVGDLNLTFKRFIPRSGYEKESMEIEVVRADGSRFYSYPKLFVNDRTRQTMANPHVHKTWRRDIYISPIQFEPAVAPGVEHRMALAPGQVDEAGPVRVRLAGLERDTTTDPMTQLANQGFVTLVANLEVSRDGETVPVQAPYRFFQDGRVETPPQELPGGGWLAMTGLNPQSEQVQIQVAGVAVEGSGAKLSIDVTRKPLIKLVWYGLYVVLFGGALAMVQRLKQAMMGNPAEAAAQQT